jgi:hypothetical protein
MVAGLLWPGLLRESRELWVAADHPGTAQEESLDACASQNRTAYFEMQVPLCSERLASPALQTLAGSFVAASSPCSPLCVFF